MKPSKRISASGSVLASHAGRTLLIAVVAAVVVLPGSLYGQIEETEWPDPVANHVVPYITTGLTHGPVLGQPKTDSMRVWVRTGKPMEFTVVYGTSLPLSPQNKGITGKTKAADDNTGYVELTGLKSNTKYYYGVVLNGQLIDTRMNFEPGFPSFQTLPAKEDYKADNNPEGLFNFSFGTSFGNNKKTNYRYGECPAYTQLLKNHNNLSFFFFNGDYIYEETRTWQNRPWGMDLYRQDYKIYMERDDTMAEFLRKTPSMFMYDDHEMAAEAGTGEIGLKNGGWLSRDVALKPWYEYAGWANYKEPSRQPIVRSTASVEKGSTTLYDPSVDDLSYRFSYVYQSERKPKNS